MMPPKEIYFKCSFCTLLHFMLWTRFTVVTELPFNWNGLGSLPVCGFSLFSRTQLNRLFFCTLVSEICL